MVTPTKTAIEYFESAEAFGDDFNGSPCLHLPLVPRTNGYVQISQGGQRFGAHRLMYEAFIGPIGPGLEIDHLCNSPGCVNPWHAKPSTPRDNVLRGGSPHAINSRRTLCAQGHPLDGRRANGRRRCLECGRIGARIRMRRRRLELKAAGLLRPDVAALHARARAAGGGA